MIIVPATALNTWRILIAGIHLSTRRKQAKNHASVDVLCTYYVRIYRCETFRSLLRSGDA